MLRDRDWPRLEVAKPKETVNQVFQAVSAWQIEFADEGVQPENIQRFKEIDASLVKIVGKERKHIGVFSVFGYYRNHQDITRIR